MTLARSAALRLLDDLGHLAEPPAAIWGVMETAHSPMVRLYVRAGTAPIIGLKLLLTFAGDVEETPAILLGDGPLRACGDTLRTLLSGAAIGPSKHEGSTAATK